MVDSRLSRELSEIHNQIELPSVENIKKSGMPVLGNMIPVTDQEIMEDLL